MMYTYKCVEIVSKRKIKEHARVVSDDKINFFVNSLNNLIYCPRSSNKRMHEILRIDHKTGVIGDMLRSFTNTIPLNFISPSFYSYIQIQPSTHKIRVRETFNDAIICTIPQHFYKFLSEQKEGFSTENLSDKLIFIEDDFILMNLDKTNEIIFHVPTQRVLSSFNQLNPNFYFNQVFIPLSWGQAKRTQMPTHNAEPETRWVKQVHTVGSPSDSSPSLRQRLSRAINRKTMRGERTDFLQEFNAPTEVQEIKHQEFTILRDLMYMNMKRYRDRSFLAHQAGSFIIRDKDASSDDVKHRHFKLVSVLPFSYSLWKLIDDLTGEKSITVDSVSTE